MKFSTKPSDEYGSTSIEKIDPMFSFYPKKVKGDPLVDSTIDMYMNSGAEKLVKQM